MPTMFGQTVRPIGAIFAVILLLRSLTRELRRGQGVKAWWRLSMEALAAISLASNLLQFTQFSGTIILKVIAYHKSHTSLLRDDIRLSSAVNDLNKLLLTLSNSSRQGGNSGELEKAWQRSLQDCTDIGLELRDAITKIQNEKKRGFWVTTAKAVRAAISEGKLHELHTKLQSAQQDVQFHLTVEQREQLQELATGQVDILNALDDVSKHVYRNAVEGQNLMNVDHAVVNEQLRRLHEENHTAVVMRLQSLDAKLQQVLSSLAEPHAQHPPQRLASGLELCQAINEGDCDTVASLLGLGADANYSRFGDMKERPLHLAAKAGNGKILQSLLDAKPLLDPYSALGITPLMSAAIVGDDRAIRIMIDAGCNVELYAKLGRPYIMDSIDIDNSATDGSSALFFAAYNGHTLAVKELLRHNANVENVTNHGFTPLIAASRAGHISVVRLLLDHGANIEAKTDQGFTSLIYAANAGQSKTVELLLDRGANIDARKSFGMTALLEACWTQRLEIVRLLVLRGADLSIQCHGLLGVTNASALYMAIHSGSSDIVKCLVEAEPDLTKWEDDDSQETPIELARRMHLTEIVALLQHLATSAA